MATLATTSSDTLRFPASAATPKPPMLPPLEAATLDRVAEIAAHYLRAKRAMDTDRSGDPHNGKIEEFVAARWLLSSAIRAAK